MNIVEAISEAASELRAAGVTDPRREAQSLLAHAVARDRTHLITHGDDEVDEDAAARFRSCVARRAAGEPLQYITGRQEFYGLDFEVGADVLIPRPETELLVETALELLKDTPSPFVCDVGTGSACVSVALLNERRDAQAVGLDISERALQVAARNAARHGVADRLTLLQSDCFDALDSNQTLRRARFDAVVSNPPYVSESDLETLQREVREHEPRVALTPGGDGLSVVRRLLADAAPRLKPGGHLVFEIGYDQAGEVERLTDARVWTPLGIRRDLQGIPRTVALKLKGGSPTVREGV